MVHLKDVLGLSDNEVHFHFRVLLFIMNVIEIMKSSQSNQDSRFLEHDTRADVVAPQGHPLGLSDNDVRASFSNPPFDFPTVGTVVHSTRSACRHDACHGQLRSSLLLFGEVHSCHHSQIVFHSRLFD